MHVERKAGVLVTSPRDVEYLLQLTIQPKISFCIEKRSNGNGGKL